MEPQELTALIGLAGAPFLLVMVTEHARQALEVLAGWIERLRFGLGGRKATSSPWPLLRDLLAVAGAFLLRSSGGLDRLLEGGAADSPATFVLVGLALSFAAGQIHDRVPALTRASGSVEGLSRAE